MQQQRVCGRAFRGVWGGGGAPVGRGWDFSIAGCRRSFIEETDYWLGGLWRELPEVVVPKGSANIEVRTAEEPEISR